MLNQYNLSFTYLLQIQFLIHANLRRNIMDTPPLQTSFDG